MKRNLPTLLAALILLAPAAALWAANADAPLPEPKDVIARFDGLRKGTYQKDKPVNFFVIVTPAAGGGDMKMTLPDKDMIDFVQKLKQGDYVAVTYAKSGHDLMVGKIDTYELKPGEDLPGVFQFSKSGTETVNKKDVTTVTVTKFGAELTLTVPEARDPETKKMAPNEKWMKVIDGLKSGDLVEVKNAGNNLQSIKVYEPPQLGEFQKVEKAADSGLWTVEVKIDGAAQTLTIAKKDTLVAAKAHNFKSGDLVYCRTTTDDKGTWLLEISKAPKGTKLPTDTPKQDNKPTTKTSD